MEPVESARLVVRLLKQLQYPAHQPLMLGVYGIYFHHKRVDPRELSAGLRYGQQQGWFRVSGNAVSMTPLGARLFDFESPPKRTQRGVPKLAIH
jgi:hypothetical protein